MSSRDRLLTAAADLLAEDHDVSTRAVCDRAGAGAREREHRSRSTGAGATERTPSGLTTARRRASAEHGRREDGV